MKLKLLILVSIILLPLVNGYGIDTISSRYFPLQVGNFWVYKSTYVGPSGNPSIVYRKILVTKDTVINSNKYYYIKDLSSPYYNEYYSRYNLKNGHFVKLMGIQECPLYDLSANTGDTLNFTECSNRYICSEILDTSIFGLYTAQKSFVYSYSHIHGGGYQYIKFSKNIGLTISYTSTQSGPYVHVSRDTLIGCKVNGIVYGDTTTTSITQISSQVNNFTLSQNYPNPFNPATRISFSIPNSSFVRLNIYNILGQNVEALVNQNMNTGSYDAEWNATNYPSGVYFYKLETENFSEVKKMILKK